MARKTEEVEGIGPVYAQKLNAAGVKTDAEMLDRAGSAKGRA
jgi:predicted flap endonuclease-1-like 5' DNA nuclease